MGIAYKGETINLKKYLKIALSITVIWQMWERVQSMVDITIGFNIVISEDKILTTCKQ
jgi:hypothetical protein